MAPVKEASQSIVRCSSQDPIHRAENILDRFTKKWMSNKDERSGRIVVEIHLSKAIKIGFINIGNAGSAYVELLVGSSMWFSETKYEVLLPSTVLMSPQDSKTGKNSECVKMLSKGDFCDKVIDQEWDRIQVICHQPFSKDKQFGLQFIDFAASDKPTTPESEKQGHSSQQTIAQFKSMLTPSRLDMTKKSPSGGGRLSTPSTPSRAAGLVQAALKSREKTKHSLKETTPTARRRITSSKTSPYPAINGGSGMKQRGKTMSRSSAGDIEDEVECFLEGCKFDEMPQSLLEEFTFRDLKGKMEEQRGCKLTKPERRIFLKLTAKAVDSVTQSACDNVEEPTKKKDGQKITDDIEVIDLSSQDMCSSKHSPPTTTKPCSPPTTTKPIIILEDIDISSTPDQTSDVTDDSVFVSCPICDQMFPQSGINLHANFCAEMTYEVPTHISTISA